MVREASLEEIRSIWTNKVWKSNDKFNLYVHNPFCISLCDFCIYNSSLASNQDAYKKYYFEYLPNLMNNFKDIMESRVADTIYFGGGTASLMTPEIMELTFSNIPHFKDIPNKVFECHPVSMNKKKVDILAKYNFSYLTFGVQTFNEEIIKQQTRTPVNFDKFKEVIQYIKDKGMKVNCDLLAFIRDADDTGLNQFEQDLYKLVQELQPHNITIYPKYQHLFFRNFDNIKNSVVLSNKEIEHKEKVIDLIIKLRKVMIKFLRKNKDHTCITSSLDIERNKVETNIKENYMITTLSKEEFEETKQYNSSFFGEASFDNRQNVLAFGGFETSKVYSYINDKLCYLQKNIDWETKFIITNEEEKIDDNS